MKNYFKFFIVNLVLLVCFFAMGLAYAGLPPTTGKVSGDTSDLVTFKYQFPNFTGTHTGTALSLGVNSVAGGGTGLSTLTANNVILGNGTSAPTFVAPGSSGNILQSNGTTWVSATNSATAILPRTFQKFLSTGTYYPSVIFFVSSANATVGATYTNNGVTFTVQQTIAAGTQLIMVPNSGTAPTASGTLTKSAGTGDATITFTSYRLPISIEFEGIGGGGGGSGAGASAGTGGTGGNTTVATTLFVGNGGAGGVPVSNGGAGGSASIGTGAIGIGLTGATGFNYGRAVSGYITGQSGASSPYGGGGPGGQVLSAGQAPVANTGAGGGGAGSQVNDHSGAGGGAGGWFRGLVTNTSAAWATSYAIAIGSGGTAGGAGSGQPGGAGAAGLVMMWENFQ